MLTGRRGITMKSQFGRRHGPRFCLILALSLGLVLQAGAPLAQETAPEPAAASTAGDAELKELIATLEDEAARQKLLDQLRLLLEADAVGKPPTAPPLATGLGAALLAELSDGINRVGVQVGEATRVLVALPEVATFLWEQSQQPEVRTRWLEILAKIVLVLICGLVAEFIVRRLLTRPRRSLEDRESDNVLLRVSFLLARTLLDLVPILGFAAAAYGVLPLTEPRPETRLVALTIINANVLIRVVMAVARMLLTPDATKLRLFRIADETAVYATIWVHRLAVIGVYGYFIAEAALLLGLPEGAYLVFLKLVGLLLTALFVVLVLQNRKAVSGWIRAVPTPERPARFLTLRERLADVWHVLTILFVLAIFGVWALGVEGGFRFLVRSTLLTAVVILLARGVILGLHKGLERGFRIKEELKLRYPRLEQRANQYVSGLHAMLRIAVYLAAVLMVLDIWIGEVFAWFATDTGRFVLSRFATVAFILLAALAVWEFVTLMIERYLEQRDRSGAQVQRSARIRTLLPMMRNVVRVVLAVIVVLTVMSEFGVNIAPLLAGAGVIGLAIGFGAQSLVKDVITGTFILLEDAIAVGDVVDLGGHAGVVESMNIRSIRLRDLSGNVHLVPFGEVLALTNMSKGFAFALMDVGIAYREDVDQVIEVLREVGAGMQADEAYGQHIMEPLEVLGLDSFGDSAVIVRVRFKTQPLKQWMVRREFNRRMKRVFDERGIEIPFPHQTIYFGVDKQGMAPPARIAVEADDAGALGGAKAPEPAGS